jgi:hypothetical protein
VKDRLLVPVLLIVLAAELGLAATLDGVTIDELVYIGSGYRHLALRDFRLNPEQPPLAKIVGAVPLLALSPRVPETASGIDEWRWSFRFVHELNDASRIVTAARMPNAALTLGLVLLLWAWARATHGPAAGLAALLLGVFHPSLLAHGHLLTTDLPAALTMTAASWAFWRWSRAPGAARAALVALLVGIAVATRLTGWLLLPAFALLEALRWGRLPRPERGRALRHAAALAALGVAIVPAVIWAAYGFRHAPWPGASVAKPIEPRLGRAGRVIGALQEARALPEAYLEGARFVAEHNVTGHHAYLLGRVSLSGWYHYYAVALAVKNTPGFLLAALLSLGLLWGRRRSLSDGGLEAHWIVPAALTFMAASTGRIQIGERYILPVYPYLILVAASAVPHLLAWRLGRPLLGGLLALHAVPSLAAAPAGYLAYFNVLAGGTPGAHRVLADSNLDWGQDLPRLAEWMRRNGLERIQLGYHGSDSPDRLGIRHEDLPGLHLYPPVAPAEPFRGTVAVSPNLLLGIFYGEGQNPYARLLGRPADDRAGVYFIFRFGPDGAGR